MVQHSRSTPGLDASPIDASPAGVPRFAAAAAAEPRFRVEEVAPSRLPAYRAAWVALCDRALEGNVFLDPGFAIPLLARATRRPLPRVVVVWAPDAPTRMVGLLPVGRPRAMALGRVRGFADKLVTTGVPLLDRDCAEAAFAAMLDWLARRSPRAAVLTLTAVPLEGAFSAAVVAALGRTRRVDVLAQHRRAVLRRRSGGAVVPLQSAKSRKERKRQRRRLMEHGTTTYTSARAPDAVSAATDAFLALEADGWKGLRGTALLSSPAQATFTRAMTRAMAERGNCRVDALELDGRAVAMGIVLTFGDRAHFWKTTFDETLAALSPGVHFTTELTDTQLADAGVALTDSCAVPDHPMIDRIWPDRMDVADLAIALKPGASVGFVVALRLERLRRRIGMGARAIIRRHLSSALIRRLSPPM